MESEVLAEPVLVGRERELQELRRCLESAKEGKGKTVFISAEAGIGKTRLVNEFLDSAKLEKNITSLSGWCLFNAGVPYFPFIEAFSNYYSSLGEKAGKEELELNSWFKGPAKAKLSGRLEYLSPQALKDKTFAAVAKTIHTIAAQNPVILVIEDIHWADSASLALIHYLARVINDSERVLVLATFRSEELTSNSEGYPQPLVEALAMMRREDLFKGINLLGLSKSCVTKMAESMLGGSLQQELAEKLTVQSEGNPLFIVESLRMLHERNSIVKENNKWRLAIDELGIPSKILDILNQRLSCLNHDQRRILDAASVIGEEFDVGLLSAVIEQDSLDVLEALNMIAHSTALIRADENLYRFDHARSREIVYESLDPPLRRGYHGRIAQKLESAKNVVLPFSDLAYHYAHAGNNVKAVKYALAAAKDELRKWSNAQAINHFRYVLENIPEERAEERRTALEGLGDAYAADYKYAEAIKTYDELAISETGKVRLRAFRKAMDAAFLKGDQPNLLLEYAQKAEKLASYDRLETARVLANKARAIGWAGRGDIKTDLDLYDSALRVFEEENSIPDIADALWKNGVVCTLFRELQEKGICELLCSVAIFKEVGDIRKEIQATLRTALGFINIGLLTQANHELANVLKIGLKLDTFAELAQASVWLSCDDEGKGRLAETVSRGLKALEYCQKTDVTWIQGLVYAVLTRQFSKSEDLKNAEEFFNRMTKLPTEILSNVNVIGHVNTAKGVYFAARGHWSESNRVFEELVKSYDSKFMGSMDELGTRENYAWALEKQGRLEEARAQLETIRSVLFRAKERFKHAHIQMNLLMPRIVNIGEELEIRLDFMNIAENSGTIDRIEGLNPKGFTITSMPSFCSVKDTSVTINQRNVGPFQVETIKIKGFFAEGEAYELGPCLFFIDDLGETRTSKIKPLMVTVQKAYYPNKPRYAEQNSHFKIEFKYKAAEKAFSFLVNAFKQDHISRRLPLEESGWRTLTEVAKAAHITMYSMYGRSTRCGKAALELRRLGIAEQRLFSGERGRGGTILKIRISYENEAVRSLLETRKTNFLATRQASVFLIAEKCTKIPK